MAIPFTTGLLVGIGEDRADRLATLRAIAESHRRHGHVQEVIVQNFRPKARTAMAREAPPSAEEFAWTIAAARLVLPPDVHLQAPPNLSDDPGALLAYGIDDFGGVSPVTRDHVNPERPWPAVETLAGACAERGLVLAARLPVYPEFVERAERFLDPAVRTAVLGHADAVGLARGDRWYSGADADPPAPAPGRARTTGVQALLARYEPGYDFDAGRAGGALRRARGRRTRRSSSSPTPCARSARATT